MTGPARDGLRPRVLGAIGALGEDRLTRIEAQAVAAGLRRIHLDETSVLWLDPELPTQRLGGPGAADFGIAWPEARCGLEPPSGSSASGSSAQMDPSAPAEAGWCGLGGSGAERLIWSSQSGLGAINWVAAGDSRSASFCDRIEPLLALTPGRHLPDWEAWASILTLGYPSGDATPFSEIRRLPPGGRMRVSPGGPIRIGGEWSWLQVEESADPDPAVSILERLRAQLRTLAATGPLVVPLSGGWDSRLIATLLAAEGAAVEAVITTSDRGNDRDQRLGRTVADALGIPVHTIEATPSGFAEQLRIGAEAQEWVGPVHLRSVRVAAALADHEALPPGSIVDGLGGDILIREQFPQTTAEPSWAQGLETLFGILAPPEGGYGLYDPAAWAALRDAAAAAMGRDLADLDGHPLRATLAMYLGRTRRYVATSPFGILDQARPVAAPLVAGPVARVALAASHECRREGALMRRLLELADPAIARLPSTHEPPAGEAISRSPRIRRSPEAQAEYLRVLSEHPLRSMFAPALLEACERGRLRRLPRGGFEMHAFDALIAFGLWWECHREHVAGDDPVAALAYSQSVFES